ncbi:MAG: lysylphosphatidylglycerol synthase transmembrane domain-containing protein [Gaiellaceae bacterium]
MGLGRLTPGRMSPRSDRRVLVALALGLPISAVFLWLAIRNADLALVRRILEDARLGFVALAILAIAAMYGLQAVRWRMVAASPQVRLARFYEMVVSGVACNNVLPARLGDLLRARWVAVEARMPSGRGLGTVVLDRGCDVAALFVLLIIGLAAVATSAWLVRIAVGAAAVLAGLGAAVLFSRAYTGRRERGRRQRGLVRRVLRDTAEALAEPIGGRRPVAWIALSLGAWTVWAVAAIFVGRSLGLELSLLDAVFVAAVMNLGVAIPSSPGFVGTYEWLGVAALGLLGIGSEEALAFSILLHACWYVPTTLGGGIALGTRGLVRMRRARTARAAVRTINPGDT